MPGAPLTSTAADVSAGPRRAIPHLPALDGLRAIALVAVLCFHAGFSWISGGYLPLSAFFVLSGFLITALLLVERTRTGRIDLRAFWGRRARRLVPAIVVTFGLIALFLAFGVDYEVPGVVGDGVSALGWVTNWRFILSDRVYADAFADPSPFQHFWSLAVEEQFYLVMPVLAAAMLAVKRGRRWPLAVVVGALIGASVLITQAVHSPGDPPLRAYFGTDTRAAELLVGVGLALVLIKGSGLRRIRGLVPRVALDVAGTAALAATVYAWFVVAEFDDRLYEGGLLLIALLAALVVAAGTQPGTVVARVLSLRPLVALGRISYGVYLFHWPLFLWFDAERTGLDQWPLFLFRMAITISLAAVSYRFLERPIMQGRLPRRVALVGWANASVAVLALVVVAAAALPSTGITLRTAAADEPPRIVSPTTAPRSSTSLTAPAGADPAASSTTAPPATAAPGGEAPPPSPGDDPVGSSTTAPAGPPPPLKVLVVGDSIAQNFATGLETWIERHGQMIMYDVSIISCGFARGGTLHAPDGSVIPPYTECDNWAVDYPRYIAEFDPDVVLVHSGFTELYDRRQPEWSVVKSPGDPVFDDFIVQESVGALRVLGSAGAKILYSNGPCINRYDFLGAEEGNRRIDYFNGALLPRMAGPSGAQMIDLHRELCPSGSYTDSYAGIGGARPDTIHLHDEAAAVLAERWLAPIVLRAGGRG
ncbi:acyltransferase family protein [soil metagenome]